MLKVRILISLLNRTFWRLFLLSEGRLVELADDFVDRVERVLEELCVRSWWGVFGRGGNADTSVQKSSASVAKKSFFILRILDFLGILFEFLQFVLICFECF